MTNFISYQLTFDNISKFNHFLQFTESAKFFRDDEGFVYEKSGSNSTTIYLDCFQHETPCVAGARFYIETGEIVKFSTHSHEKPDEHTIFRIEFEAFLKKEVIKHENASTTVLNLYKKARNTQFRQIWLPVDHQSTFLAKLRRIRKYEREKAKSDAKGNRAIIGQTLTLDAATSPVAGTSNVQSIQNQIHVEMVDAATSPFVSMIRRQYSRGTSPLNDSAIKSPYVSMIRRQTTDSIIRSAPVPIISRTSLSSFSTRNENETPSRIVHRFDYISPSNAQSLNTVCSFLETLWNLLVSTCLEASSVFKSN